MTSINDYPIACIDKCIMSFLDKINNSKDKVYTCSKKVIYFCLSFTVHHGLYIGSQLSKLPTSVYSHISIRLFSRPSCSLLGSFLSKTKFPLSWNHTTVVYLNVNVVVHSTVAQTRQANSFFTFVFFSSWFSGLLFSGPLFLF